MEYASPWTEEPIVQARAIFDFQVGWQAAHQGPKVLALVEAANDVLEKLKRVERELKDRSLQMARLHNDDWDAAYRELEARMEIATEALEKCLKEVDRILRNNQGDIDFVLFNWRDVQEEFGETLAKLRS